MKLKLIILFLMLSFIPSMAAQQTIKKKDAKRVIEQMEGKKVHIKRFKIMKKQKAYKLSKDMKKWKYNVVYVEYEVDGYTFKRIFDVSILK